MLPLPRAHYVENVVGGHHRETVGAPTARPGELPDQEAIDPHLVALDEVGLSVRFRVVARVGTEAVVGELRIAREALVEVGWEPSDEWALMLTATTPTPRGWACRWIGRGGRWRG
jgi:hypothetical protein